MTDRDQHIKFQCLSLAIQMGAGATAIDMAKQIEEYVCGPVDPKPARASPTANLPVYAAIGGRIKKVS